jgi:hypothetical protein
MFLKRISCQWFDNVNYNLPNRGTSNTDIEVDWFLCLAVII